MRTASFTYDLRGNRSGQTITLADTTQTTTAYQWDFQNRLIGVTLPDASQHSYAYDYRTRRIGRDEDGTATAVSWSGGLSLAEYSVSSLQSTVSDPQSPEVEYRRGPDMGGGIGGLLHTLRDGVVKYNLSNGRGDIVAQSNQAGALTWTASYEAFGTRPVEYGSNADRQRANTKEEDPTGLLWEHFRYRDLETGVWLSRDPAGFVDGPNLYAYVNQNPWTSFDPLGLSGKDMEALMNAVEDGNLPSNFTWGHQWSQTSGLARATGNVDKNGVATKDVFTPFAQGLGGIAETAVIGQPSPVGPAAVRGAAKGAAKSELSFFGKIKNFFTGENSVVGQSARGISENANFAQKTFGHEFSEVGQKIYSKLTGSKIRTVNDLAAAIKSGAVNAQDIPVEYVMKGEQQLIVNTRTSEALKRAGVDRAKWNAVDKTSDADTMKRVNDQLRRNKLDDAGTPTVRESRPKPAVENRR